MNRAIATPPGEKTEFVELTPEEQQARANEEAAYRPKENLNEALEAAFLAMLPKHLGQAYLTDDVIDAVMAAKVRVTETNKMPAPEQVKAAFSKAIVRKVKKQLPAEMAGDCDAILVLIP